MGFISAVLALIKAIPALERLFQSMMAIYISERIAGMKKENLEAIRKAIREQDQRDLEAAVGNPHPGDPSGDPGSVIVDKPPRLH